jgi:crotonobetainyl-CoA:carnitine CoA-transferase CaiB-like acyl-CoA transferase
LKVPEGQAVLKRLIRELPADIFASNTLPKRYEELGIDYATLREVNPGLIWAGISAMGPEYPSAPGYDPPLQGMTGTMDITGDPEGPPMLSGVPFVDLKAGDEVFANVCLALAERAETGEGTRIDVSMVQATASWLITTIPLLDLGYTPEEVRRSGNEHREFVPVNVYPTADGYIYLAIGNDVQWARLVAVTGFESLSRPERDTNDGRKADRVALHQAVAEATRPFATQELVTLLNSKGLVASPIHTIPQVLEFPPVRDRLLYAKTGSGQKVRLPPPSVERPYLEEKKRELPYAPSYGQSTEAVLKEVGYSASEIADLKAARIVA